ncbi:MAG: hypothetical protein ACRD0L_13540 [Acidimicrobiales bacterium]
MARINDVGGMEGFGPVDPDEDGDGDGQAFHADWEARVFAINSALVRRDVYTLDDFRDAIERMPPDRYLAASYYERWLAAVTTLAVEKGILGPAPLVGDGAASTSPGHG